MIGFGSLATIGVVLAACSQQPPAPPTAAPAPTQAPPPTTAPAPTSAPAPAATVAAQPTTAAAATSTAAAATTPITVASPTPATAAFATAQAGTAASAIKSGASLAGGGPPQPGGTLKILTSSDVRGLDPGSAEGSSDWWAAGFLLYNFLYFYDKDGKLFPDVASDYPKLSADATTYTIPLRKGVKFHNGRELKAADAKFSLEWQLWPDVYSWGKTYAENIVGYKDVIDGKSKELSGVKVLDDYTIQVQLSKPQAVFPGLLSYSMWGMIPKAETIAAGKDFGTKVVIGTGPFKFVSWDRGQKVTYTRHKDYFRAPAPYLDGIEEYLNVQGPQELLQFESGSVDKAITIPSAELPRIFGDPKYADMLRIGPTSGVQRLVLNFKTKPLDNVKLRQAIAHAIDKDNLVKLQGGTAVKMEGFYCKGMLQYDPEFKSQYQHDPAKAMQLLSDAGFANGITGLKFWPGSTTSSPTAEAIQADLKSVGIQVDIVLGSRKDIGPRMKSGDVGMDLENWAASMWDAYDYISAWSTCASMKDPYNSGNYCNNSVDQMVDQAEKLPLQDDRRIQLYHQIQDTIINQDVAWVGMYSGLAVSLSQPYVHNDWPSGLYSQFPFAETIWMSKH
jgi:ABC-type transport system substrate-binding protein